jgi:hypothetical protein
MASWLKQKSVGAILQRCSASVVEGWLARAKQSNDLNCLLLSDEQRSGYLPRLLDDIDRRLGQSRACDSATIICPGAAIHGKLRYLQGYSIALLVHEARILEVVIFGTLHNNLSYMDFNLLLPDIMAIADEVDSQLEQSIESYVKLMVSMQFSTKKTPSAPRALVSPNPRALWAKPTLLDGFIRALSKMEHFSSSDCRIINNREGK